MKRDGGGVVHKEANSVTRKKWCSGEASARRLRMISGKKCAERWRREVLEKYRVEEAKKSACRGRGEPRGWRIVMREKIPTRLGRWLMKELGRMKPKPRLRHDSAWQRQHENETMNHEKTKEH